MKHSPEPWKIERRGTDPNDVHVVDANDTCVLETDWVPGELERLDYARIVACVNLLKGVANDDLEAVINRFRREQVPGSLGELLDARSRLRQLLFQTGKHLP